MITVTFANADQARYVAEIVIPSGVSRPTISDTTLTIHPETLEILSNLTEDEDGHFDGEHVWVGGSEYPVERPSRLGRPRIGPALKIRVPDADLDSLTERSRALGVDRTALIRQYIRDGLAADASAATTTTNYGSWTTVGDGTRSVEDSLADALGMLGGDYDVDALADAYRTAIDEALPDGVSINGNEFYGPYPAPESATDMIRAAVKSIDFWSIADRFDTTA